MSEPNETVRRLLTGRPVKVLHVRAVGAALSATLEEEGGAITIGSAAGNDLVLDGDKTVSRYHAELRRELDSVRVTDLGSTNGTESGGVRWRNASVLLAVGARVRVGETELELVDGEVRLAPAARRVQMEGLIAESAAMQDVAARASQVAASHVSVLLEGESGVGKEVVARAIHDASPRAGQAFVTVDCGAITASLFGSLLFGHERGSFTGASQRHVGAFERAHGGTLFLDEVGELPLELQTQLLGALERKRITRLGGDREIPVDVRVVAATNRDLRAQVNDSSFRLDLYYRLAVVRIEVPPLRQRIADIAPLAERFLAEEGHEGALDAVFDAATLAHLERHPWPGNVRELRNVVHAALAMGPTVAVMPVEPESVSLPEPLMEETYETARGTVLRAFERRYLTRLLERADGKVRAAARIARMDRSYLTELLRRHGLR